MSRMIDTLPMARTKFPGAKHSLDALCSRFGVDRSARVKHGALLDAELLAQVYVELKGGRQIGLGLDPAEANEAASIAVAVASPPPRAPVRSPRPHAPTEQEAERHRSFIARMDAPLWQQVASTS